MSDPSNENTAFRRVRLRSAQGLLAREGLTPERLAATAARLGRARSALEAAAAELLARGATPFPQGYAVIDAGAFASAPDEVAEDGNHSHRRGRHHRPEWVSQLVRQHG